MKLYSLKKEIALPLSVAFIVNPFFIQNLLYRFDSLGMTLAIFSCAIAFYMRWSVVGLYLKVFFLIICLNFYQPFANLFLGLVGIELALLCSLRYQRGYTFSILIKSLIVFTAANLVYFLQFKIITYLLSYLESFTPTARDSFLAFELASILEIFRNFAGAFKVLFEFWSDYALYILIPIPFLFVSVTNLLIKRDFPTLIGLVIASVFIFVSGVGPMAMLDKQVLSPRVLSYFPAVMMMLLFVLMVNKKNYVWVIVFPIFACFVFSYRVGNIHHLQREYETPIMMNLTQDLATLKKVTQIYSVGSVNAAPFSKHIIEATPFRGFLNREAWMTVGYIRMFGETRLEFLWRSAHERMEEDFWLVNHPKQSASLYAEPFYKIYVKDSKAWIVWTE